MLEDAMMAPPRWLPAFALLGVSLSLSFAMACAKADEPKAPGPAASTGASTLTTPDASAEVDAAGALRALPMPQKFPQVTFDAATWDAGKR